MDTLEIIKKRRSIRQYSEKEIPADVIEKIIDAARFAPTARNVQPWQFVAVTRADILRKLADLAENGRFLSRAKACIGVFCSDTKYYLEDGCAATCNILLAATALEVGSCWIAGDKKEYCAEVAKLLNAPAGFRLVSLISLGYPESGDALYDAEKKNLKGLIHWEKF